MTHAPPTLEVKYRYPEGYDAEFVNGAIGQLNASGEAVIHFFHERAPLPRSLSLSFGDELEATVSHDPDDLTNSVLRMVKSGVIVNRAQLREFRDLLDRLLGDNLDPGEQDPSA